MAVAARHLGNDELRGTPGVESARTRGGNPPQRRFELGLAERRISRECAEVSKEVSAPVEYLGEMVAPRGQQAIKPKSVMCIAQRGREIGAPGEPAEAPMQLPQARHRARDAGGASADRSRVGHDLAARIEVHAGGSAPRSALAVVEEVSLAIDEHGGEPAAAEVACLRIGHRERESDRDRGVDRVAAGGEDLGRSVGAVPVGRGHRGGC